MKNLILSISSLNLVLNENKIITFLKLIAAISIMNLFMVSYSNAQTGYYTLNGGTASFTGQTYNATTAGQSAIYVINSGNLTLTNCIIVKSGNASSVDSSSQWGINAGVLARLAGIIVISGGTVTTTANGGNGLFATGSNSKITMSNGTISANGSGAHGVDVTYTGTIILNNVNVTTSGANSSVLATDFGGGTVTVTGGTIIAADTVDGSHSAGIYSTGVITVTNATVKSLGDCGGVIDGANSIILNNTSLFGKTEGIKTWRTAPSSGTAYVTITGGSLTVTAGDGFYVTGGAVTVFTVSGGTTFSIASGKIINVLSASTATLNLNGENVSGNLRCESSSTLCVSLTNGTTLTGDARYTALTMDSTSVWIVTANSILTTFSDAAKISGLNVLNIVGNGYNVHYDSTLSANSYLHGYTYNLVNGGYLTHAAVSVGISEINSEIPSGYLLSQNYPNPFNPSTKIIFTLPKSGNVSLEIYNSLGAKIETLVNGKLNFGSYAYEFNAAKYASGIYFYRLTTDGYVSTKKMVFIK